VNTAPDLGSYQSKLMTKLDKLLDRTHAAIDACRDARLDRAKARLKELVKGLTGYRHILAGRAARKKLDPEVRASFLDAGEPIKADALALRGTLACPDDAP
jgi:hypothetical protein